MQLHPRARRLAVGALILAAAVCTAAAASSAAAPKAIVTATLTSRGPVIAGPHTWHAGAARIAVVSRVPDEELTLMRFRPGYTYARFLADGRRAQGHTAAAHAALRRIFDETVFAGGVDLFTGQTASFTVTVRPGTYYLGEMTSRPHFTPIRVTGVAGAAARAASAAVITATDSGYRLDPSTLPANGSITIRNAGARPHRLNLIPVAPGTTRAQLGAYIRKTGARDNAPAPSFALNRPQLGTADISAGQQMQLSYRLAPGEYALIDFDQDMTTGRPEALNGMYAIATLR
jgi:hypothetical protein